MKKILIVVFCSLQVGLMGQSRIPYPIIFIHGLNSNSDTWNDFTSMINTDFGLRFGGELHFCLNNDNNYASAVFSSDYKDFTATNNTLTNADYYYINFDVDSYGNVFPGSALTVKSNQQAIFKQGRAVRDAIKHVLSITGKNKVILVGHSMGGLASREYLSNPEIWQSDGKHHVAKLFTTATPHGGSNSSLGWLDNLMANVDEQSEAVRDLRTFYTNLIGSKVANGVYLFGGVENNSNIYYGISGNYRNIDINCNGILNETITGLYSKYSPSDIFYSCAIGTKNTFINGFTDVFGNLDDNGDRVVGPKRANMNNYMFTRPPLVFSADTFIFRKTVFPELHTEMPKEYTTNMRGLDEPNDYNLGYDVNFNQTYMGWISEQQGQKGILHYDVDIFKFKTNPNMLTRLQLTTVGYNINDGYLVNYSESSASSFVTNNNITDVVLDLGNSGNCYLQNNAEVPVNSLNLMYYLFKITELPKISIIMPENQFRCIGNNAFVYPTVMGTGNLTYKWSDGSTNLILSTSILGTYTLTVTGIYDAKVSNPIAIVSPEINIVTQPISQTVCGNNLANLSVTATGANLSYLWSNNANSSTISTSQVGNYTVTVSGSCGKAISNLITVSTCTSAPSTNINLNENVESLIFSITPNPTNGELKVENNHLGIGKELNIYSIQGIKIYTFVVKDLSTKFDAFLPSGVYVVKLGTQSQKLIVW